MGEHIQHQPVCAARGAPPTAALATLACTSLTAAVIGSWIARESDAWQSHFLPLLLSDLEADSRAAKRVLSTLMASAPNADADKRAAFACPVHVFCGTADPAFGADRASEWQAVTSGPLSQHLFLGGHARSESPMV